MGFLVQKLNRDGIASYRLALRKYGKVAFTNGCFDILHPGHIKVLRRCRQEVGPSGLVVVGLNSDESIRRLKGPSRPIMDEGSRVEMVCSLEDVDVACIFNEDTPYELIKSIVPDVIVKGGDYIAENVVGYDIARVVIQPLVEGYSTTGIVEKIRGL